MSESIPCPPEVDSIWQVATDDGNVVLLAFLDSAPAWIRIPDDQEERWRVLRFGPVLTIVEPGRRPKPVLIDDDPWRLAYGVEVGHGLSLGESFHSGHWDSATVVGIEAISQEDLPLDVRLGLDEVDLDSRESG